jgi:hypothetical protein
MVRMKYGPKKGLLLKFAEKEFFVEAEHDEAV